MDIKAIFEALPHVNSIWVTGEEFHLHPHNGGKEVKRESLEETKVQEEKPEPKYHQTKIKKHK